VTGDGEEAELSFRDGHPLSWGHAGVFANPSAPDVRRSAFFRSLRVTSLGATRVPQPRFAYRFAGAVEPAENGYRVRLSARTTLPESISFEIARSPDFSDARVVGPLRPRGRLGSVTAWVEGLEPDARYVWRPVVRRPRGAARGPVASLRTPPPPGSPVVFVFASCTSGRMADYPSFARAASYRPAFLLHAGDWGYADGTSYAHSPDHFQARWTRLLRSHSVGRLVAQTPLLFWQDDHDYQADNGWAETVPAYAVRAFDELHANPGDEYFDVRWGDVHVWCLDCRLYASDPAAPDDAAKTRLGAAQKAWLKQGMASSDAPVRIVASAMAFRDKVNDDVGWHNVYTHERDELLRFFSEIDATTLILSGDSHGQRLIHHHEFGELFEITSSGTDFPPGLFRGQGLNDPEHTLIYAQRTAFALVRLDPAGAARKLTVSCISSEDGEVLLAKSLPVG
jgi:phosphodiesterase/alkaline phosphatase D-like protein